MESIKSELVEEQKKQVELEELKTQLEIANQQIDTLKYGEESITELSDIKKKLKMRIKLTNKSWIMIWLQDRVTLLRCPRSKNSNDQFWGESKLSV